MTYYISENGNDSASGTSPADAWRTLARVSRIEFAPGDSILLETRSTWPERLAVTARGVADAPVVIGAYLGDAPAERPVRAGWDDGFAAMRRPRIVWGDGPVVSLVDCAYVTVRGLEIECASERTMYPGLDGVDDPAAAGGVARHPKESVNFGILAHNRITAPGAGITIEGNYVHGRGPDQNSEGILVTAETSSDTSDPTTVGVQIARNLVENVGWRGIGTGMQAIVPGFTGRPWQALRDVVIERNAARFIGLQGICAFNAHDVVMRRNLVDRAGWYRGVGAKWGPAGLWPWSCADVVIEYNEVTGMFDGNTGADATGIDIDWNSRDVIVRYNHCYSNMGAGIVTMSCLRGRIEANRVEGNLGKVNIGPGQIGLCDYQTAAGPHGITGVTDVTIRDNLIILDRDNTTAFSAVHISEGPEWERVGFTDNRIVFFDHAAGQYAYDIGEGPTIETYSGNTFFGTTSGEFRAVAPGGPYAWESWRAR
ncbi:MAG: hypothetical protein EA426_17725, partial [Spirochaetaceae bacterium]